MTFSALSTRIKPSDAAGRNRLRERGRAIPRRNERLALVALDNVDDVPRDLLRSDDEPAQECAAKNRRLREPLGLDETRVDGVDVDPAVA